MRYEYIEPFVASTIKVLDSVLQSDIARGNAALVSDGEMEGDLFIMIPLRGESEGSIILNMAEGTALKLSNVMNGTSSEALTPLGMDSIAEVANMIAGNATGAINDRGADFKVSPPMVMKRSELRGRMLRIETLQIPLFTECGEITVNVAMRMN